MKTQSSLILLSLLSYTAWTFSPRKQQQQQQHALRWTTQLDSTSTSTTQTDFSPFLSLIRNATTSLRDAVTSSQSHDPFRYEWGTWVDTNKLHKLMTCMNQIQAQTGILATTITTKGRYTLAPNCYLHVLPAGTYWQGKWPTGSWTIVKPLIGVVQVGLLRDDDDTAVVLRTLKELRGGTDGTLGGGGTTNAGDDCVKFVGGPIRRYTGKSQKTILLEVVLCPPIGNNNNKNNNDDDALYRENEDQLEYSMEQLLRIVPPPPPDETTVTEDTTTEDTTTEATTVSEPPPQPPQGNKQDLGTALGMKFDQVGGLEDQLEAIARRVLASRANPQIAKRLGISHVRGILLSGPPGCGKTLLARELARLLGAREPQVSS